MRRYASVALRDYRVFNLAAWPTYEIDIDFTKDIADIDAKLSALTDEVVDVCPVGRVLAGEAQPTEAGQAVTRAGEGIIWTLVESLDDVPLNRGQLFNFKTKGAAFATAAHAPKVSPSADKVSKAQAFARYALAERRFEQGVEFVEQELVLARRVGETAYQSELLPKFTAWVIEDATKEERYMMDEMGVGERLARKAMDQLATSWFSARVL